MGPLKSRMEILEFCVTEKTEELVSLQLKFDQFRQEARSKQAEHSEL